MKSFEDLVEVVARLRGEGGCPWDREQTHATLKAPCIEEAAEVVCGINILDKTGNASNLMEELGDLLFQVVMHARIAEEEGLFTIDDVNRAITEKMIRRHPHVFGETAVAGTEEVLQNWEEIKKIEKKGKLDDDLYIDEAFDESVGLIERARQRKAEKRRKAASDEKRVTE
ncbi:MAG: nucleotide pyrophosphohydrolase [Lachnospiraceae bacterium]|nr:nucleotide pyrophosphohydrolase [Lachnospiraceae bacterium]